MRLNLGAQAYIYIAEGLQSAGGWGKPERKEKYLLMWPDLRKEAWSPRGISPGGRSHLYANAALQ